ncbi:uncharacterized protein J3R85_017052 [Psidium guajava]|nr:uncharacterized protein J3R85_017052 [Psidium guajava]
MMTRFVSLKRVKRRDEGDDGVCLRASDTWRADQLDSSKTFSLCSLVVCVVPSSNDSRDKSQLPKIIPLTIFRGKRKQTEPHRESRRESDDRGSRQKRKSKRESELLTGALHRARLIIFSGQKP